MGKKVGVASAIFVGLIILCCLGGGFTIRQFLGRIKETVSKDQTFVRTALTATAKNWDEKDFSIYADDSFNQPSKREETRKLFATLKDKLGPLESLGTVELPRSNGFRPANDGSSKGLFLTFIVKAKFQKRDGVFEVTIRNNKDHQAIYAIGLNPDSPTLGVSGNSANSANNSP